MASRMRRLVSLGRIHNGRSRGHDVFGLQRQLLLQRPALNPPHSNLRVSAIASASQQNKQMKAYRTIWITTVLVATLTAESRGDFNGTDDFTDNSKDPELWGTDLVAGGLLTEANGRLEYTTSGIPSGNDLAVRPWILNFGSYTQNWEIQIDVSVPRSPYKGISLPLAVFPGTDLNAVFANRFSLELNQFQDYGDKLKFQATVSANSAQTVVGRVDTISTSAALRIAFEANTKVLSAYYDEDGPVCGYSWRLLGSTNVPAGWNMTSASVFGVIVVGGSQGSSVVSTDNVFVDNFRASSGNNPNLSLTRIGNEVVLAWATNGPAVHLESCSSLASPICWQVVANTAGVASTNFTVTNTISSASTFFRLSR